MMRKKKHDDIGKKVTILDTPKKTENMTILGTPQKKWAVDCFDTVLDAKKLTPNSVDCFRLLGDCSCCLEVVLDDKQWTSNLAVVLRLFWTTVCLDNNRKRFNAVAGRPADPRGFHVGMDCHEMGPCVLQPRTATYLIDPKSFSCRPDQGLLHDVRPHVEEKFARFSQPHRRLLNQLEFLLRLTCTRHMY